MERAAADWGVCLYHGFDVPVLAPGGWLGLFKINAPKSMLGHTMGAASAIEAAVCALAIRDDRIPPTINLEEADPECDLDYVPNEARAHKVEVAMNNAYAFGGANASLVLRAAG